MALRHTRSACQIELTVASTPAPETQNVPEFIVGQHFRHDTTVRHRLYEGDYLGGNDRLIALTGHV